MKNTEKSTGNSLSDNVYGSLFSFNSVFSLYLFRLGGSKIL